MAERCRFENSRRFDSYGSFLTSSISGTTARTGCRFPSRLLVPSLSSCRSGRRGSDGSGSLVAPNRHRGRGDAVLVHREQALAPLYQRIRQRGAKAVEFDVVLEHVRVAGVTGDP